MAVQTTQPSPDEVTDALTIVIMAQHHPTMAWQQWGAYSGAWLTSPYCSVCAAARPWIPYRRAHARTHPRKCCVCRTVVS